MTNSGEVSNNLISCIEAILFAAAGPVSIAMLGESLRFPAEEIENALNQLEQQYKAGRGLSLQWFAGKVQLTTSVETTEVVERFLGLESTAKLTRPALETLTIIAYRQPITRPTIDTIRGVSSDGVLKNLLSKGLIQEVGRLEGPGRPILYSVTADFLQHFGLASLADLPPYESETAEENEPELLKD